MAAAAVSVDTSPQGLAPPADVEMLSAQSSMDVHEAPGTPAGHARELSDAKTPGLFVSENADTSCKDAGSGGAPVSKVPDKTSNKTTLSEDTKALVKQALLNATQRRQRAESQSEDTGDGKPLTAMQKMKQRVEKRRQKKERALEKIKKNKSKKGQSHTLSNQDVELLRRWTSMQQVGGAGSNSGASSQENSNSSPPHPGPTTSQSLASEITGGKALDFATSQSGIGTKNSFNTASQQAQIINPTTVAASISVTDNSLKVQGRQIVNVTKATGSVASLPVNLGRSLSFTATGHHSGGAVLIPSSQLGELSQASFIPVIAVPSNSNHGKIEIKRMSKKKSSQQKQSHLASKSSSSSSGSSHSALESTKNILQSVLRERNQGAKQALQPQLTSVSQRDLPPSTSAVEFGLATQHQDKTSFHQPSSEPSSCTSTMQAGSHVSATTQQACFTSDQSTLEAGMEEKTAALKQDVPASPLNSAGRELMEFLDQLRNSSAKLKLASAGSASLQSPRSFSAISPLHETTGSESSDQSGNLLSPGTVMEAKTSPVVRRHNSVGAGHLLGQQQPQRPNRSSLPLESYLQPRMDSTNYQFQNSSVNQPELSSVPSECGNNIFAHKVEVNPLPFTNYMQGDQQNLQEHHVTANSTVNSFINTIHNNSQDFEQQQPSMGMDFTRVSEQFHGLHHQQQQILQTQQQNQQYQSFQTQQQQQLFQTKLQHHYQQQHEINSTQQHQQQHINNSQQQHNMNNAQQNHQQQQQQQHHHPQQINNTQEQHHQEIQQMEGFQPQPQSDLFLPHLDQQQQQQQQHQQQQAFYSLQQQIPMHATQQQQQYPQTPSQNQHMHYNNQQKYNHQQQQHQTQMFDMYASFPVKQSPASSNEAHHPPQTSEGQQAFSQGFIGFSTGQQQPMLPMAAHQMPVLQPGENSRKLSPSTSAGSGGSRSPGLTVDCSKNESSRYPGLGSQASMAGAAPAGTETSQKPEVTTTQQRQADLIAMLSKQLSRAEVVDIFPPALALTPRGTGAGYGVGMDLDGLLTDAQDGAHHRTESSPLSSSLLADWLDLSSNISQADLEALERDIALQSPMSVSYGDLGL